MPETAKHTPGPWRACGNDRGGCICGQVWSVSSDVVVAIACDGGGELSGVDREEMKPNARLIASSPCLLEACKAALAYIESCVEPSCDEGDELEDGTIHDGRTREGNLLRAAIAKATTL